MMLHGLKKTKERRKHMSPRMVDMLERIRIAVKIKYTDISSYNDIRTINGLLQRNLVQMDMKYEYYELSYMTDEYLERCIRYYEELENV